MRDNVWRRIRTNSDEMSVQTILFWSGSRDTVVERNLLLDPLPGLSWGKEARYPDLRLECQVLQGKDRLSQANDPITVDIAAGDVATQADVLAGE